MNDIVSPLQSISYTNKDFVSVYEELLDLTKELTSLWDPSISNESDPGVILLKLNAVIADKCNYAIDKSILECFPLSVTQEANARQLFEQLGYYMHWYKAASTVVHIKWIGDPVRNQVITIPKFTMVTDNDSSVIYTLLGPSITSISGTYNISDQVLNCNGVDGIMFLALQGLAVNYDINGNTLITAANLDSNNRLYFPTTDVAENGIFIRNASEENYTSWRKVDNLLIENSGNTVYKFGVLRDGSACYIEFPEDVNALFGEGIYITYIRTNGSQGNVSAQYISKFYNFNTVVLDNSILMIDENNVSVTNYVSATDGLDGEDINSAYKGYTKTVGTFDTLVTLRDYINYINNSGLVSNGFVCDRSNDIQETYKIISSVNDINQTINIINEDSNITAFSLKLYLLNYIRTVSGGNYLSTYKMLSNDQQSTIKTYVYNTQTINHEFLDILDPTATQSNICFFKNKCPIDCTIITQSTLTTTQSNEMKQNIMNALYGQFNSKELDFGDKFPYDLVYRTILESDSRIKNVSLGNIDYTTYAVYQDSTRKLTYTQTDDGNVWLDDEWNIDNPSKYGITVSNPVIGATINLPVIYKDINITDSTDIVYFCSNNKDLECTLDEQTYIDILGITGCYDKKLFKYENSKWNIYTYDPESKNWVIEESDVDLSDYGITLSGVTSMTDVQFKIRLSYAHQFRNDIYVKSILAGITQFFIKDETFDYRLNNNYRNQIDNIEKLWSNVDITLGSNDINFPESEYTLKQNEALQFYAPNLLETASYSNNVKFEYKINNTILKDADYQLGLDEYIIFYWKTATDDYYQYHSYGSGTIISPNFRLDPYSSSNVADIQSYYLLSYEEVSTGNYSYKEKSSALYGDMSSAANAAVNTITSANKILSSTKKISTKQISQFDISPTSNYGLYWILNYAENDKYVLFTEGQTSRILNTNEMFIFTNPTFTSYTILGAGTEITRDTIGDVWQVDVVDTTIILSDGLSALKNVYFQLPANATITATENLFTTLSNQTTIRISPNSDNVYSYITTASSANIELSSFDAVKWKASAVGTSENTVEIKYVAENSWTIVDGDSSYSVTTQQLEDNYGAILTVTASVTTSDKINVDYELDYSLKFNRESCIIAVPVDDETTGTKVYRAGVYPTLSDFIIRYKAADVNEWETINQLLLTQQSGWKARSLLGIRISPTVYQVLLENQSIHYNLLNDSTEYIIKGANKTLEDYDNNIPASYPVCLMSSFGISSDGGDIIDSYIESFDSAGTLTTEYLSLYEFKKQEDLPESISLTNPQKVVFSDSGNVNFTYTPSVNDRSIYISLPIGEYIIAVKNYESELENVVLTCDGQPLTQMYDYTTTDISDKDVYYMYLPITSIYSSRTVTTTLSNMTVSIISDAYENNYGNGTYEFTVEKNEEDSNYILIDSYGNELIPIGEIPSVTDYDSFGIHLSRVFTDDDIGKVIIVSNEHELNLHIEGHAYDCMIQLSNCYKYVFPENISNDNISFIQKWISYLDTDHIFKYNYEVPENVLIEDPLDPNEFFNSNHLYNKFTISQIDKIKIK